MYIDRFRDCSDQKATEVDMDHQDRAMVAVVMLAVVLHFLLSRLSDDWSISLKMELIRCVGQQGGYQGGGGQY